MSQGIEKFREKDGGKVLKMIAQWLRNELRVELEGVPLDESGYEYAIACAEIKLASIKNDKVRAWITMLVCPKMPGLIHLTFGPERVIFRECGCIKA